MQCVSKGMLTNWGGGFLVMSHTKILETFAYAKLLILSKEAENILYYTNLEDESAEASSEE